MANPGYTIIPPAPEQILDLVRERVAGRVEISKALLESARLDIIVAAGERLFLEMNAHVLEAPIDGWTYTHNETVTREVPLSDEEIRASAGFWRFLPMSVLRRMKPTTRTVTETHPVTVDFSARVRFPDFSPWHHRAVYYARQSIRNPDTE